MLPRFVIGIMVLFFQILYTSFLFGNDTGYAFQADTSFNVYTDKPFGLDASRYLSYFKKNEYFNGTLGVDLLIAVGNSLVLDLPFNSVLPEDRIIIKAIINRDFRNRYDQYQLFVASEEDATRYVYLGSYTRGDDPQILKNYIINFNYPSNSFILKGLLWDSALACLSVSRIRSISGISGDKHVKEEEDTLYALSLITASISILPKFAWLNRFSQATAGTTFLYSCIRLEHFVFGYSLSKESERKNSNSELYTYIFGIPVLLLTKYYLSINHLPYLRIFLLLLPHFIGNIVTAQNS